MFVCPRCHRENDEGRQFCFLCGAALGVKLSDLEATLASTAPVSSSSEPNPRERSVALWATIVPGGGHFALRIYWRAVLYLLAVGVLFGVGIVEAVRTAVEFVGRVSSLESADLSESALGVQFLRALGFLLGAAVLHLMSIVDAAWSARRAGISSPAKGGSKPPDTWP